MNGNRFAILSLCIITLCAGIIFGPALFDIATASLAPTPAYAAGIAQGTPDESGEIDALPWHRCNISTVNYQEAYLTVYCSNPVGAVNIFLYPSDNATRANRYLAVALTAAAAGKDVQIRYNPDPAANPSTCNKTSCRGMVSIGLVK